MLLTPPAPQVFNEAVTWRALLLAHSAARPGRGPPAAGEAPPRPRCPFTAAGAAPGPPGPCTPGPGTGATTSELSAVDPAFAREVALLAKLRHPNSAWLRATFCFAALVADGPAPPPPPLPVVAVYAVAFRPRTMLICELGVAGRRVATLLAPSSG